MLNHQMFSWSQMGDLNDHCVFPEVDKEVFALIEHDVVHDGNEDEPFICRLFLRYNEKHPENMKYVWELHPDDQSETEKYLQQCFTVVAWRYSSKEITHASQTRL